MVDFYQHQTEALNLTENFNRCAYYLDMGLGKTFVGAEKLERLKSDTNIIVCQKSKIDDWIEHFKKYYGGMIFNLTDKKQLQSFLLEYAKGHNSVWTPPTGNIKMVGIINYELAFRRSELLNLEHFTLMLDESSMIQNDTNKRTKFILKMHPDNVILLSGTPTSGKYENLWSQMNLLGWNISKELYNKHYVNWTKIESDGFIHKVVDKDEPYKNVERLKQKMREHGAIFMKTEDCFELPEQTFIPIYMNAPKEYGVFRKKDLVTIDGVELVGDSTLSKRLYSRMLCGQYCQEKLQAFRDIASSTNDRLIVFYNFNKELRALTEIAVELEKPISFVNGTVKDLEAYENEDNSITLVQYQAGAMGLNFQKANKVIYFTLTDKSELFEQSKKRIHRIGQENHCFYYILMCRNSVEEKILDTLNERKDFTDELFKEYTDCTKYA